jgi:hypothetical protein
MNANTQMLLLVGLGFAGVGAYVFLSSRNQQAQFAAEAAARATSAQQAAGVRVLTPTGNPTTDVINGISAGVNILAQGAQVFQNLFSH